MSVTTVEQVCAKAGVSADRLAQFEYTDDDILEGGLADVCDPWNLIGKHLGLQDSELNAIDGDYRKVQEKRVAVLQRRREGRLDGTYLLLVKALVSCKKVHQAVEVCQVFKDSHPDAATGVGLNMSDVKADKLSSYKSPDQVQIQYNNGHAIMQEVELNDLLNPSSDYSRELLHTKCIVNQLDKEVRRQYARFATDLERLFKRKGVSVNDAIHCFAYYLDESALTSDMREATNIGAFLLALKCTQSWYNFDTTAHLAEDLGDDEGKKLVESYEAKLKVHLEKRTKEFKTQTEEFVVKVNDKREHFTEEKIVEFRNTVVKLMNIKHKDLILKSIKKGCVELTYLFQSTLAPTIRKAIGECNNELKELQLISVSINGKVVWPQLQESEASTQNKPIAKPWPTENSIFARNMDRRLSFLDFLLAEALASGLAHGVRNQRQEKPPPENFFELPNEPQAWEQFKEASKKENMIVCIEFVTKELSRSTLFVDLAREHEGIPFVRVTVSDEELFENVRKDVGGVTDTPSIVVVFFGEEKTLRVKYEGVEEILNGVEKGTIDEFIKEFISKRVKLKMDKKEQELQQQYEKKEQQLRQEYEDKMRDVMKREEELKEEAKKKHVQDDEDNLQSSQTRMRSMSFLDVVLAKALASGLAHDTLRRQESLRPSPDNYFVLSKDPNAWKQFKEDGRKENLVFCMEFIDEDMSSRVFIDLAREFDGIPFVRVQVGQGIERSFEEVRKDIGGVQSIPSIVIVFFGKENNKDKLYRVKFGGLQEIQDGLISNNIKKMIKELISRRVALKQKEAVQQQVQDKEQQLLDKEQQLRQEYEDKMREISEMEEKLKQEEAEKRKNEIEQRSLSVSSTGKTKTFSESMSPAELAEWLLEDLGSEFADDIDKLKRHKINGSVFLQLPDEAEALKQFNLSFGFKALLPTRVKKLKPKEETDQDFIDWKRNERKIMKFSESLGPSDLALWLFQEIGNDYRDDIEKLKANKINGKLFLELEDSSIMNDLALTYGFKRLVRGLLKKRKDTDHKQPETKRKRIESICESESTTKPKNDPGPLKITMNPSAQVKHCKQGTVLTVRASGPGSLCYQWMKNGVPINDDTLPNCTGAKSDSLRFTILLPEHSGSYKCRISSNKDSIESKVAVLEVPATMKFTDFIKGSSECQDGHVTVYEVLEERFSAYLQKFGYAYDDDRKKLEEILADIHTNATVKFDNAVIDFLTRKQVEKKLENIGDPKIFTNREMEDHNEQFQRSVAYSVGSEITKSKWCGWSTSGELTGTYQGVGASASVGYEKGKSETRTHTESTQRTEVFDESVLVPSETRVKVVVEKQFVTFNCKVSGLEVTFKKNKAKIGCRVKFGHKGKTSNETFKIKQIFDGDIVSSNQKGITVRMSGKCIWSETSVCLRRYDPEPLQGLDYT